MATKQSSQAVQSDIQRRGPGGSPAFLVSQVGAHAAGKFAERLAPLGLTPAHVGLLRLITASPGSSQQDVAEQLGVFPSRLVALLTSSKRRGLSSGSKFRAIAAFICCSQRRKAGRSFSPWGAWRASTRTRFLPH